jgi:hypothetical protein
MRPVRVASALLCLGMLEMVAGCRATGHGAARTSAQSPVSPRDHRLESDTDEYLRFHPSRWPSLNHGDAPKLPPVPEPGALARRGRISHATKIRAYAWADDGSGVIATLDLPASEAVLVQALADDMDARLLHGEPATLVRCDFTPHHAFVFLDAAGVATAMVEPCFECGQWRIVPSSNPDVMNDHDPPAMTAAERSALARVLDAHHLGAWAFSDDTERVQRVLAHLKRSYGGTSLAEAVREHTITPEGRRIQVAFLAQPPPVNHDLTPRQAAPLERKALCDWYAGQFEANGQRFASTGFDCKNGLEYGFSLEQGECENQARACDRPIRILEPCLRALARGPDSVCATGLPPACEDLGACALGLRVHAPGAAHR